MPTDATAQPRRLGRWRSRAATVAVAFVAAVAVLVGPTTTRDAAQAFVVPPVVASVAGAAGTPASVLAFSPAGFAITAGAAIGWLAWENREQIGSFAADAWEWLTGDGQNTAIIGKQTETQRLPYARLRWQLEAVDDPRAARITRDCQITAHGLSRLNTYGDDVCAVDDPTYGTNVSVSWQAVCQRPDGTYWVQQTPDGGGWGGRTSFDGGQSWPALDQVPTEFFSFCAPGETVRRVMWWNDVSNDRTAWPTVPGTWNNGGENGDIPTKTRIDLTCTLASDPDPLNSITVVGEVTFDREYKSPKCPDGYIPVGKKIHSGVVGDDDWALVQDLSVDGGAHDKYPDCITVAGASRGCETAVFVDGQKCVVGAPLCWDWKAGAAAEPQRYECRWGPYVMPLEDCGPLGEAYRTGYYAQNPDIPGVWYASDPAGNPAPQSGDSPQPEPQPEPQPDPASPPGANPGGTPDTSGGADPDGDGGSCWSAMISWNPVDWVFTPIKCALVWAFVPDPATIPDTMGRLAGDWNGTVVGEWVGVIEEVARTVGAGPAGGAGCSGPPLTGSMALVGGGQYTIYPFSTCEQPMATVATVVRAALTVSFWMGVGFVSLKLIFASIGLPLHFWGSRGERA